MPKMKNLKACSFCDRQVYKLANPSRGLCAACYNREKRNGSLEYRNRERPICTIGGCENPNVAQGMCELHYRRFKRHGVAEHERFDKWGHRDSHPLAHTYYWMRRSYNGQIDQKWLDDFWEFARDVGDRPTPKHRLRRIDPAKQFEKGNVFWEARKLDVEVKDQEGANAYARAYRAANPELYREQYLKKKFGKDLGWYRETLESQDGVCAICKKEETATGRLTGMPRAYAVDHCHTTGKVRGLLCSKCNTGIGSLGDDVSRLRSAIAYLERHC